MARLLEKVDHHDSWWSFRTVVVSYASFLEKDAANCGWTMLAYSTASQSAKRGTRRPEYDGTDWYSFERAQYSGLLNCIFVEKKGGRRPPPKVSDEGFLPMAIHRRLKIFLSPLRVALYRRWLRSEDFFFDQRYGLSTGGLGEPPTDPEWRGCWGHAAIPPRLFRGMLRALRSSQPGFNPSDLTFVDFGCGKGRALILAWLYGFRRVIGVELNPDLASIARQNIERWRTTDPKPCVIEADAREFEIPDGNLLLYFYNPFNDEVFDEVLRNIVTALRRQSRKVIVFYPKPDYAAPLERTGMFLPICRTPFYAVYRSSS